MSPGLTARRQGFSVGNAMSSTTYGPVAVDRVIVVVTSCGQRDVAVGLREVAAAAGAVPLTRIENSIGVSCGPTFTNATLSAAALLAVLAEESIVTRAPGVDESSAIATPSFFAPTARRSGVRDGPTWKRRAIEGRPSFGAETMDSVTLTPAAEYSSTALSRSIRMALKRPRLSGIGPRPTSSRLGAGSRGSVSESRSPACHPG